MKYSRKKQKETTFKSAISDCIEEILSSDASVFVMGTGVPGLELKKKYKSLRVRNTPISESALIGMAIGASRLGMRPIVDLMMSSFLYVAMDQLVNQAGKSRYMFGGAVGGHFVCKVMTGFNSYGSAQHSSMPQALFAGGLGIKIIFPSNPYDAKGLLRAAVYDNNPVIFFEHFLLRKTKGKIPEKKYALPIGKGNVVKKGTDISIITYGPLVSECVRAAEESFKENGISAEIIDLRTLWPLDKEMIINSVRKTGRAMVAEEAPECGGFSSYISCIIQENSFDVLKSPVKRINLPDIPTPFSAALAKEIIITKEKIKNAIKSFF